MKEVDVSPLLQSKRELETALEIKLSQVAVIKKRLEAITAAINVLRSSDDELAGIMEGMPKLRPNGVHPVAGKPKPYYDKEAVQMEVLEYAQTTEWFGTRDLMQYRESKGQTYVPAGTLRNYIAELHPTIKGEREQTKYKIGIGKG